MTELKINNSGASFNKSFELGDFATKKNHTMSKLVFPLDNSSPEITYSDAFNIDGLYVEKTSKKTVKKASKKSKIKATAKDYELLKSKNADFNKNNPNASAQFVEGTKVEVSPSLGDNSYEHPDTIRITDMTNGHPVVYYYRRLTPDLRDGKHFAKFGKNMPINQDQFEDGKEYYILVMVINKETNERIDKMDHLEIYRLDYSYDPASDTSTYNLIQDKGMDGSGQSSIDYNKR